MRSGLLGVLVVAGLGLAAGLVGYLRESDFLKGMAFGLLLGVPWAIVLTVWRGYRQMDEYGKLMTLRACSVAFVSVMLAAITYYPLEQAFKLPALPLWALWVLGWTVWGVTQAVSSRSR